MNTFQSAFHFEGFLSIFFSNLIIILITNIAHFIINNGTLFLYLAALLTQLIKVYVTLVGMILIKDFLYISIYFLYFLWLVIMDQL